MKRLNLRPSIEYLDTKYKRLHALCKLKDRIEFSFPHSRLDELETVIVIEIDELLDQFCIVDDGSPKHK